MAGQSGITSTEVFNPKTGDSGQTRRITEGRRSGTFCNNFLCGGSPTFKSCEKFDGISSFEALSVSLIERREHHLCWGLPSGEVLLLGGRHSHTTTELVSADGSVSSTSFTLPYETM